MKKMPKKSSKTDPNESPQPANVTNADNQDSYDIFVSQGIILAGPVADKLKASEMADPVTTIGDALFDIASRVESEGAKHGIKFELVVMLNGVNEIMGALLKMIGKKLPEEQMKGIIGHIVGRYLDDAVATGKMTREQVSAMANQVQQSDGMKQAPQQNKGILGGVPQPGPGPMGVQNG